MHKNYSMSGGMSLGELIAFLYHVYQLLISACQVNWLEMNHAICIQRKLITSCTLHAFCSKILSFQVSKLQVVTVTIHTAGVWFVGSVLRTVRRCVSTYSTTVGSTLL